MPGVKVVSSYGGYIDVCAWDSQLGSAVGLVMCESANGAVCDGWPPTLNKERRGPTVT
eukprot:COSAG02_NODE_26122_length_640_cov_0.951941_1_plen_57_part_10